MKRFGSVGVFPPTEPMHLISILFLQAGHTSSKNMEIDSTNSTSESSELANMYVE
jgi:hypothetical protein